MKANITKDQIVSQLINTFRNNAENTRYNSNAKQYIMLCGWCGYMSPISRPAYIAEFGAEVVAEAEKEARNIIAADAAKYAASEYYAHRIEADAHLYDGQPAPHAGAFVWAVGSGLKCDDSRGIYSEVGNLQECSEDGEKLREELVKVEAVYNVSAAEFADPATADRLAARQDCPGGICAPDDHADYLDGDDMFYTLAAAVVDPSGRYYLINNEGNDYARYILLPLAWQDIFADIAEEIEAERTRKEQEEQCAADAAKAARLALYKGRCEKWANLMTEIKPYEDAEKNAARGSSEFKAAHRKLAAVRRANILAMCRAAFPGVKFSVKKHDGWGGDWLLTWTDGPTVEALKAATDLDLFETYRDTFDGYTDSADISCAEFTEFARRYMGTSCNAVKIDRKESEEARAELLKRVFAVVPECKKDTGRGYFDYHDFTADQAVKLAAAFGVDSSELFSGNYNLMPETVAHIIWTATDYTAQAATEAAGAEKSSKGEVLTSEGAENTTAAPSLRLIAYSAKALAVVGDTKPHKEKLKSLGGRFNAHLTCGAGWIFSAKREKEIRQAFGF